MAAGKKKKKKKAKKAEKKAAKQAKLARKGAVRKAAKPVKKAAAKAPRKAVRRKPAARVLKARHKPESLRLRSAGPSFTVNDIGKSLAFYRDVLGFTVKERWEQDGALHGVELLAGSVSFWLGQDDWKKGRDRVKGRGFRMHCGTTQDVDALAGRIKAAGGTIVQEPKDEPWGGRAFALIDPDGFTITIASGL